MCAIVCNPSFKNGQKKKKKSEYLKRGGERERASAREKGRGELSQTGNEKRGNMVNEV